MSVRGICILIGCLFLATAVPSCLRAGANPSVRFAFPPVAIVGAFWIILGFLLSRKGVVRRIIAFPVGFIAVGFVPTVVAGALYSPRPMPFAVLTCLRVFSVLVSGALAIYAPEPRKPVNEPAASDQK